MDTAVELLSLHKSYNGREVVRGLSLKIRKGEFFSLLGESGSGKSTTLRMLSGLENPTSGQIFIGGTDSTGVPPERRPVNTVFQNYALFEHLDVWENVAFGLRRQKVRDPELTRRVGEALELVRLPDRARSRSNELSGGQRQRVALARAVVNRPEVLLLDEPLAALDLKLRRRMQIELKQIQRELGMTFVFVTHDQDEALSMSDRIAVMDQGVIRQCGSPEEIYERPDSEFVAEFIGTSNLLPGVVEGDDLMLFGDTRVPARIPEELGTGSRVSLCLRPEKLLLGSGEGATGLRGTVRDTVYAGSSTQYLVQVREGHLLSATVADSLSGPRPGVGDEVGVEWATDSGRVLAAAEGSGAARTH